MCVSELFAPLDMQRNVIQDSKMFVYKLISNLSWCFGLFSLFFP